MQEVTSDNDFGKGFPIEKKSLEEYNGLKQNENEELNTATHNQYRTRSTRENISSVKYDNFSELVIVKMKQNIQALNSTIKTMVHINQKVLLDYIDKKFYLVQQKD